MRVTKGKFASDDRKTMAFRAAPKTMEHPKMTLESFGVRAWLYEFEPKWRNAAPGPVARDTQHPRKANVGENFRLGIIGEEPSKLNAPFRAIRLVENLFGHESCL